MVRTPIYEIARHLGRHLRRLHERFCICHLLGRWKRRRKPQRSISLGFTLGEFMSSVSLNVGQSAAVTPVPLQTDATVTPGASLSSVSLATSDASVATVEQIADGSFTLRGIAAGTVSLSGSALVTDPDGAVSTISGSATVVVSAVPPPPPPPPPAAQSVALGFEFGVPA